jgi:hypothetical protein
MSDREDLDWLAYRYVADELDGPDTYAFEARLEDDQDAREAVARAYALMHCIRVVESEHPDRVAAAANWRQRLRVREWAVAAAGLAACLVLTLALVRLPRPEHAMQSVAEPSADTRDTDRLAVIWSETRQPLDDPLWPPEQLEDEGFDGPVAMADLSVDDDWIAVAVLGLGNDLTGEGQQ